MENILEKIIAHKRVEVEVLKKGYTLPELEEVIAKLPKRPSLKESITKSATGIIAEFKRRSPSKGWINERAAIQDIIPEYARNGAAGISVLTDFSFFGGTAHDLEQAATLTTVPLLRKDFIVDEYQIYQAKIWGASAILLIASALTPEQVESFARKAKELRLDVLLEIHNDSELGHINQYVDMVGVNNRNLSTFVTDIGVSMALADKIPNEFLKISESGISDPETVRELRKAGYSGFLMGENFMKTDNPGLALGDFIKQVER